MSLRPSLPLLIALSLAAGVPAAHPAAAASGSFVVRCEPETLVADDEGRWMMHLALVNLGEYGAYVDSIVVHAGPAASDAPGPQVGQAYHGQFSLGSGDSTALDLQPIASLSTGRIDIVVHYHDRQHPAATLAVRAIAAGSALDLLYPSRTLRAAGQAAELVCLPAAADAATGAGLLLLPGEGADARDLLRTAALFAKDGVSTVILGSLGRGLSDGREDYGGPASLALALSALDTLGRLPGVDVQRLAVWGVSNAGTTALLVGLQRPSLRAVVAQGATYDLWARARLAGADGRSALVSGAGRDSAAWKARSPLFRATAWKPGLLVLHGVKDELSPIAPARAFAAAAAAAGAPVDTAFIAGAPHALGDFVVRRATQRFLRTRLAASP